MCLVVAEPSATLRERASDRLEHVAGDDLPLERRGNLLRRLGAIAEVREEAMVGPSSYAAVTGHQGDPAAAGETGQVAHVDGCGDEEDVDLALGELGREPRGALEAGLCPSAGAHPSPRSSRARSSVSAAR